MKRGINMKVIQIVVLFLSLFVMLGGLALPLWWNAALPYIHLIPGQLEGIVRNMSDLVELVLKIA